MSRQAHLTFCLFTLGSKQPNVLQLFMMHGKMLANKPLPIAKYESPTKIGKAHDNNGIQTINVLIIAY